MRELNDAGILISVVIPAFNRRVWLEHAIYSALVQKDVSIEIIVVDDFSTEDIYTDLVIAHCRYFRNSESKGAQWSRNFGASVAKGKYIAFLDNDDVWSCDEKLCKQYRILESNHDIVLCFSNFKYIDGDGAELVASKPILSSGGVHDTLKKILLKDFVGSYSGVMVRKSVFHHVGGCDESLPARQDWDLWTRFATQGDFWYIGQVLFDYRIHQIQISSNPGRKIIGTFRYLEKHKHLFWAKNIKSRYIFHLWMGWLLTGLSNYDYKAGNIHHDRFLGIVPFLIGYVLSKVSKVSVFGGVIKAVINRSYLLKGSLRDF